TLPCPLAPAGCGRRRARAFHDVRYRLLNASRRDAMLPVELQLPGSAAVGFLERPLHRAGDPVGVQDRLATDVPLRPPDGLDERVVRSEEALLVRIENRNQ